MRWFAAFLPGLEPDPSELGRETQSGYPDLLVPADYLPMRVITLHKRDVAIPQQLPDNATVYEAALERLSGAHENDAATCLACCTLEIVPASGTYPQREQLVAVRLILSGPGDTMATLERNPEIRGRIRQALDGALGPAVYLTQMAQSTCANALAA